MARLLSLQDRNPLSPTYGSFHRSYWHHRTADFPSAIMQMGVHALALVWCHRLEDNPYYQNERVLEWCVAGFEHALDLQHADGSWDEWYPNERGWAGPTGYLLHALAQTETLLGEELPARTRERFKTAATRAALHLIAHEEEHVLANHYAIALLPVYEAFLLTSDPRLAAGYERLKKTFQSYCYDEGWCLEYDGADLGYLGGTMSFLARLHTVEKGEWIEPIIARAAELLGHFVYPDGSLGGALGSRQTVHAYPMGFEYWSSSIPASAALANWTLGALERGTLLEPDAHEDHYIFYRVPEFIEAYLAHAPQAKVPELPYERAEDFERYFKLAGLYARKIGRTYWTASLAKGGVLKGYDVATGRALARDSGWIAKTTRGAVITPQWNDKSYERRVEREVLAVSGQAHYMVTKLFTPFKLIVFRVAMALLGGSAARAHRLKSVIRKRLMVGARPAPVRFERRISFEREAVAIEDVIEVEDGTQLADLRLGDEFFVRYVPQSRYFHSSELGAGAERLSATELATLNRDGRLSIKRRVGV